MNSLFNVEQFDEEADYGILDDMSPEFFKHMYKSFLGAQKEFTITDKYRKKIHVKWGKPVIWLCNPKAFQDCQIHWDMDWIEGNTNIVKLTSQLY